MLLQVDDRQLLVLISQLRLNSPQAKPQLQRVIYNLGQHHGTLRAVLRLVLALLRSPLSPDEAETAMEEDGASAPRSLQDALQVIERTAHGCMGEIEASTVFYAPRRRPRCTL